MRNSRLRIRERDGFAMLSIIMIFGLMMLVCLGMISLARVTSSKVSVDRYRLEAEANCRMALLMALGELQKEAGSDRRITADSDLLGDGYAKHLLGVWDSVGEGLEEGDHLHGDRIKESYSLGRKSRFRRWLVPGEGAEELEYATRHEGSVVMVGKGSIGESAEDEVMMPKVNLEGSGSYSWWIGQENTKAKIGLNRNGVSSFWEAGGASSPSVRLLAGLENIPEDKVGEKVLSHRSIVLGLGAGADVEVSKRYFFDVSPHADGLLTNANGGGVKRDLNLLLERSALPSEFSGTDQGGTTAVVEGSASWEVLRDYYRNYKPLEEGGKVRWEGGVPVFYPGLDWDDVAGRLNWHRNLPIISKWYWLMSHYSVRSANQPDPDAPRYELRMVMEQVQEIWNPFNLPFKMPEGVQMEAKQWNMPYGMSYYVDGQAWADSGSGGKALYWVMKDMGYGGSQMHNTMLKVERILEPGEVRVYSDGGKQPRHPSWNIDLQEGWSIQGGLFSNTLGHGGTKLVVEQGTMVNPVLEQDRSLTFYGGNQFTDYWLKGPQGYPNEHAYHGMIRTLRSWDQTAMPLPKSGDHRFAIEDVEGVANKRPFAIVGARLRTERVIPPSSDSPVSKSQETKVKGYLFTDMGGRHTDVRQENGDGDSMELGALRSLNHSPYIFFTQAIQSFNDYPIIEIDHENRGYLGTSNGAREPMAGQNHLPMIEIPIQPLISMAQLQHAP